MKRLLTKRLTGRLVAALLGAGVAAVLSGANAVAAPQILALVASDGPIALHCVGEDCRVELSAFCLQPDRAQPAAGTAYRAVDGVDIHLLAKTRTGQNVRLPAGELVAFTSARRQVAVTAVVNKAALRELGLEDPKIVVGAAATLLPVASADDRDPQTPAEIALASGPLRSLGERVVDRDHERMVAARMINQAARSYSTDGDDDEKSAATIRRRIVDSEPYRRASPAARAIFAYRHDYCRHVALKRAYESIRDCLVAQHDSLMDGLNQDFLEALETSG